MRKTRYSILAAFAGGLAAACGSDPTGVAIDAPQGTDGVGSDAPVNSGAKVPEIRCDFAPTLPAKRDWNKTTSAAIALASPLHRGLDLIASVDEATQRLAGIAAYGTVDKALTGENIDVYACNAGSWQLVGTATTDSNGEFAIPLTGDKRLGIGLRDMMLAVQGDNSVERFLALVVPQNAYAFVSDVDGTLTEKESAFQNSLVTQGEVGLHPGAAESLRALAARGYIPVYVSSRSNRFTSVSRKWFIDHQLPRGVIRFASALITIPGDATVELKTAAIAEVESHGITVDVGIGNRGSDVKAYSNNGLAGDHTWMKMPEYNDELVDPIAAGQAIGFENYADLLTRIAALPQR